MRIGFRTSPQNVEWAALEDAWAEAGRHAVFESGWLNDHLGVPGRDRGGSSFEPLTAVAALAHHVPGKIIGQTVLSATFRHPSILAREALTLDHISGGRYVLGIGAGWHQWEHDAFGIGLPSIGERLTRLEAQVRIIRALFSEAARREPGVRLDAPPSLAVVSQDVIDDRTFDQLVGPCRQLIRSIGLRPPKPGPGEP